MLRVSKPIVALDNKTMLVVSATKFFCFSDDLLGLPSENEFSKCFSVENYRLSTSSKSVSCL